MVLIANERILLERAPLNTQLFDHCLKDNKADTMTRIYESLVIVEDPMVVDATQPVSVPNDRLIEWIQVIDENLQYVRTSAEAAQCLQMLLTESQGSDWRKINISSVLMFGICTMMQTVPQTEQTIVLFGKVVTRLANVQSRYAPDHLSFLVSDKFSDYVVETMCHLANFATSQNAIAWWARALYTFTISTPQDFHETVRRKRVFATRAIANALHRISQRITASSAAGCWSLAVAGLSVSFPADVLSGEYDMADVIAAEKVSAMRKRTILTNQVISDLLRISGIVNTTIDAQHWSAAFAITTAPIYNRTRDDFRRIGLLHRAEAVDALCNVSRYVRNAAGAQNWNISVFLTIVSIDQFVDADFVDSVRETILPALMHVALYSTTENALEIWFSIISTLRFLPLFGDIDFYTPRFIATMERVRANAANHHLTAEWERVVRHLTREQ